MGNSADSDLADANLPSVARDCDPTALFVDIQPRTPTRLRVTSGVEE